MIFIFKESRSIILTWYQYYEVSNFSQLKVDSVTLYHVNVT